jgi:hypothetical protein
MTQFAFENLMPPGLTGEVSASNACGGHVRPEVKGPQASPVKQEFVSWTNAGSETALFTSSAC